MPIVSIPSPAFFFKRTTAPINSNAQCQPLLCLSLLLVQNCALNVISKAPKGVKPCVLVDGNFTPPGLSGVDAECIIGGDGLEYCIAAASIIAKVTRDRLMVRRVG